MRRAIFSRYHLKFLWAAAALGSLASIGWPVAAQGPNGAAAAETLLPGPKPADAPVEWKQLVGIYHREGEKGSLILLEKGGRLYMTAEEGPLEEVFLKDGLLMVPDLGGRFYLYELEHSPNGMVTSFHYLVEVYVRKDAGSDPGNFYHITPAKPVERLREEALREAPPAEAGPFRKSDLVEIANLDAGIHLDVRYAKSNNFLGTPVYTQERAFLQRPAAEALLRVSQKLQPLGYGLLIHDAYRPWYVTKIFWEATPPEGRIFVADPKKGSKHNRGCAVDLTLYDLATGAPVEMTGLYDEMSSRSFPSFPGGTSLQRWHRDLLRRAMESEGFTVNVDEWWHFDYKDWKKYAIGNVAFERLKP